jgi:hypothetical protein
MASDPQEEAIECKPSNARISAPRPGSDRARFATAPDRAFVCASRHLAGRNAMMPKPKSSGK